MTKYHYSAFDGNGRETKGTITAEIQEEVISELKSKGLFPVSIHTSEEMEKLRQVDSSPREKIKKMTQAELRELVLELYDLATDIETICTFDIMKRLLTEL